LPARDTKLVEEVLSLDRAIRYCGVIDKEGKIIAGGMRKGVNSLEPSSLEPKLITQLAILLGADKGWDAYLGKTDYFLIHKSKVNLALFPIAGFGGVLVSTEPSFSINKMDGILQTIVQYGKA
jgi:hypothetical protein